MKFNLLLFLAMTLFFGSCKQKEKNVPIKPVDYASFYQYSVVIEDKIKKDAKEGIGLGTGFFVREKGSLYLVSNYHVLTGWNTAEKMRFDISDTLHLALLTKKTKKLYHYPIGIKKIKDTASHFYYWEKPDLFAYPLPDSVEKLYEIYPIESFIDKSFNSFEVPYEVFSLPYFFDKGFKQIIISGKIYSQGNQVQLGFRTITDTSNYIFTPFPLEFVPMGGSGSPVFFRFITKDNLEVKEKIVFGGVIFGREKPNDSSKIMVVRPEGLFSLKEFSGVKD